ncbi:YitT family protein [Thermoactinomyces sp. AMNI-1]|uniref:YitT family protein n=1 Tax=Thermoactinomyces mirandus TaxID=2756294 RepID=A0A7W1XR23_9BACL|nr:YitT family protein [Thermoactinomyces mirandus]
MVESPILAAFWGSLLLGIGVGIIFRYSGFTDGVRQATFLIKKQVPVTAGQNVMVINLLILALAGLIFGWKQAVYSIFGYLVSLKTSEYVMNQFCMKSAVWIETEYSGWMKYVLKRTFKKSLSICQQISLIMRYLSLFQGGKGKPSKH